MPYAGPPSLRQQREDRRSAPTDTWLASRVRLCSQSWNRPRRWNPPCHRSPPFRCYQLRQCRFCPPFRCHRRRHSRHYPQFRRSRTARPCLPQRSTRSPHCWSCLRQARSRGRSQSRRANLILRIRSALERCSSHTRRRLEHLRLRKDYGLKHSAQRRTAVVGAKSALQIDGQHRIECKE